MKKTTAFITPRTRDALNSIPRLPKETHDDIIWRALVKAGMVKGKEVRRG